MALEGEYEPSPQAWVRDQMEAYPPYAEHQAGKQRQIPVLVASHRA